MKWRKRLFKYTFFVIVFGIFAIAGVYFYANLKPKLEIKSVNSFFLYDQKEELYFQGSGQKEWVTLDEISSYVIDATITIEDKNFYSHHGFDILRIGKALFNNIKSGKIVEGASTITQQYAKNLYLSFDKTIKRKIDELWYTIQIESHYTKDEILEGYLNTINYGHGMYGIENASQFYFNKKSSELSLAEATMLVNIPKSPNNYSPVNNFEKAKERQKYVLKTLLENKVISQSEYDEAINEEMIIYGKKDKINLTTLMYYQDAVFKELETLKGIPSTYLDTGGLKIYTNLDIEAQTLLEQSVNKNITNNDEIQANGVMIDPNNGKIIALLGGRDYSKSQYNRSLDSYRQVGSTMKPILYYAALENGFTSSSAFLSEKTTFTFSENNSYSPKNHSDIYGNKPISLASAIAYSDNVYAVKTHLFLGEETMIDTAYKMGIKTKLEAIPSLPLGTVELNILEITNAYATLANEGVRTEPYFIEKVTDMNGNILYEHKHEVERVLDPSQVYILNELLSLTYDYNMIDYSYPTNISINALLSNKYAVKSGSTSTDNWMIGFNKNVVTSIWIGYDDNREMSGNDYKYAKKIWANTMESYLKDKDNAWYLKPNNVVGVLVDPISGEIENESTKKRKVFYYLKGTEPFNTQDVLNIIE